MNAPCGLDACDCGHTMGEVVERGVKLYGWLSEAYGVAWKLAGYHAERIRERDGYKEALKGCCSRIGGKWHRLGCEAFQRPYGECDYACVQARKAIEEAK